MESRNNLSAKSAVSSASVSVSDLAIKTLPELVKRGASFSAHSRERIQLDKAITKALSLFINPGIYPYAEWAAEVILMAAEDKRNYSRYLDNYLTLLKSKTTIKPYLWEGLADLLAVANTALSPGEVNAVFTVLIQDSRLNDVDNQKEEEMLDSLAVWQRILSALAATGTQININDKTNLEHLLDKYETALKNHSTGRWQIKFTRQALLRISDNKAALWKRTGMHLLSVGKNGLLIGAAVASSTTNYGLGAIGALPPIVESGIDLARAGNEIFTDLKRWYDKEDGYETLTELEGVLVRSAYALYDTDETRRDENTFFAIIQHLIDIKDNTGNQWLAYGLLETVLQLLKNFPGKTYATLQDQLVSLMKHYLHYSLQQGDKGLLGHLWSGMAALLTESIEYNVTFVTLCLELVAISPDFLNNLPLTQKALAGLQGLYHLADRALEAGALTEAEQQSYAALQSNIITRIQKEIIKRVKKHPTTSPLELIDALLGLKRERTLSHIGVNTTIAALKNNTKYPQLTRFVTDRERVFKETTHLPHVGPSLTLTTWESLTSEERAEFVSVMGTSLSAQTPAPITKANPIPALFGEVNNLVVGAVQTGGFLIHLPKDKKRAAAAAKITKALGLTAAQMNTPAEAKESNIHLAGKVTGTAFIASYLSGGVQVGTDEELRDEAVALARELMLSTSLSDSTPSLSAAPSSSSSHTPPIAHSSLSSFFASQSQSDDSFTTQLVPNGLLLYKQDNIFIIKIELHNDIFEDEELFDSIQRLLKSRKGIKSDYCENKRVKETPKGNIEQVGFVDQKAAQILLNALIEKMPISQAENTLGKQ